ncbi:MAG: hypothetical protein ACOVQO_03805, partial [Limnohabitans sp.]
PEAAKTARAIRVFFIESFSKVKKELGAFAVETTCLNTKPTSKFGRLRVLHQSRARFPSVSNNKGVFRCIGATNHLADGCLKPIKS